MFRRRREDELDEEIRTHLEMETERRIEAGQAPEEARASARRDFGNIDLVKEVTRDAWGGRGLDTVRMDVRYGWRSLRRTPVFTVVALASLALSIGATTAVFTLLNAVLWKPLPVAHPEQLVYVGALERETGRSRSFPSELLPELQDRREVFAGVAARSDFDGIALRFEGRTERAVAEVVTAGYFQLLGVRPYRGRTFADGSDGAPWEPVAVLSHALFRRRFGADTAVLGRTIDLNGYPFTIIGVMPPGFCGLRVGETPDLWLPAMRQAGMQEQRLPALSILNAGPGHGLTPIARVRPEVARESAAAAADLVLQRWIAERPNRAILQGPAHARFEDASRGVNRVAHLAPSLSLVLALAALVVFVACLNLAGLLMARAAARRREMATRLAVGAGRGRLIRALLVESLLLACGGGFMGFILARAGASALAALLVTPGSETAFLDIRPDGRVWAAAAALSFLTTLVFGLVPALQASRPDLTIALKPDSVRGTSRRFGRALIVGEIAITLMLIVTGGLFWRSLRHLRSADPRGSAEVLMMSLKPVRDGGLRYPRGRLEALYPELERRVRALPGVVAVGLTSGKASPAVPRVKRMAEGDPVRIERDDGHTVSVGVAITEGVSAGFFPMFGIEPIVGRVIKDEDAARRVVVISDALARDVFGTGNPVGRHIRIHRRSPWSEPWEIVGVVPGTAWSAGGPAVRVCLIPFVQPGFSLYDGSIATLLVRADLSSAPGLASRVLSTLQALDRELPAFNIRTVAVELDRGRRHQRLLAVVSGLKAGAAALLAAIGLYGLIAYTVAGRTREIGIRFALGAARGDVLRMVLRDTFALVALGALGGLPIAWVSGRLVSSQLQGVAPQDPSVLAGALGLLIVVGAAAGWLPARRAAAVCPATAVRNE